VRLTPINPIAWELALRVVSDPGILRRALLSAAQVETGEVIETTLEALARREKDLGAKVANLVDLAEAAGNQAARESYETRINERSAEIEAVTAQTKAVRDDLKRRRKLREEAETTMKAHLGLLYSQGHRRESD
jgi:hypothetical protein